MVNAGVVCLIIVLCIILVSLSILIIYGYIAASTEDIPSETSLVPSCDEVVDVSALVQIGDTESNCRQNGFPTSLYYIGKLSNSYDYVVAPFQTQPLNVCVGFCESYSEGVCTGSPYNGKSAQVNFDECMGQIRDNSCVGVSPIAAKGTIIYYPFSPTCNICDGCST